LSNILKDTGIRLAGTRKTTPGFRIVEKYALLVGGCDPHRFDLSSMVMLKDNHVDLCGGNIQDAVKMIKSLCSYSQRIEVECRSLEDAMAALEAGADVVMLDNAGVVLSCAWAEQIRRAYPKAIIEVSGGIDEIGINLYSQKGRSVDVISMGSLTQDMQHVDFSLCIV
jgi:nicotinate-nucleotide pyrophosphorylase (carboxylating)